MTFTSKVVSRFLSLLIVAGGVVASLPSVGAQSVVLRKLQDTGSSDNRVNIVVLGDGYVASEQEKFFADAQKKIAAIATSEAFAPFSQLLNGYAAFTASNESGTDIPDQNITRDTYYDTSFQGDRLLYVATANGDTRALNVLRSTVPDYDIVVVVVNTTLYGGSGGSIAVTSLDPASDEVVLHELGHSFARLTDEYVDTAYGNFATDEEFINSSQKADRALLPWAAFILDSTPVVTVAPSSDANYVGAWEGSYFHATGFYRPTYDSKMRTLGQPFGPVNLRAFSDAFHRLNINNAVSSATITTQPASHSVAAGDSANLSVAAVGTGPFTYQWTHNGKYLIGQTQSTLVLQNLTVASSGNYAVAITNGVGTVTSSAATISIAEPAAASSGRVVNIAARALCTTGNGVTIGGFVISGTAPKRVLVRAVGPSLIEQGLGSSEVLTDPTLRVFQGSSEIASNDNWADNANASEIALVTQEIGAARFSSGDSQSSAVLLTLSPGVYSFITSGKAGTSGVVLLEVYDADGAITNDSAFVNIATRTSCSTGNGVTIGGFVISGNAPKQILLRAVGPSLASQGIPQSEVLLDPVIELHRGAPIIASNDNWSQNANAAAIVDVSARIGAAPMAANDSKSSALLVTLEPGAYSFVVSGSASTSGIVLVEVYDAD